jgi:hypothetical protein
MVPHGSTEAGKRICEPPSTAIIGIEYFRLANPPLKILMTGKEKTPSQWREGQCMGQSHRGEEKERAQF